MRSEFGLDIGEVVVVLVAVGRCGLWPLTQTLDELGVSGKRGTRRLAEDARRVAQPASAHRLVGAPVLAVLVGRLAVPHEEHVEYEQVADECEQHDEQHDENDGGYGARRRHARLGQDHHAAHDHRQHERDRGGQQLDEEAVVARALNKQMFLLFVMYNAMSEKKDDETHRRSC